MSRTTWILGIAILCALLVVACVTTKPRNTDPSKVPAPADAGSVGAEAPSPALPETEVYETEVYGTEVYGTADAANGSCAALPSWLSTPSIPGEVQQPQADCNFQQFMWQSLIALVQRSEPESSVLQFETWMPTYGIFVEDGKVTPWGTHPPDECSVPADEAVLSGRRPRVYSKLTKQAGADQPLIDLANEYVYYAMSVDKNAYDMIVGCDLYLKPCAGALQSPSNPGVDIVKDYPQLAFPDGAVELKTSWMVLSDAQVESKLFYTVPGWIQFDQSASCRKVNLGLTGMHIVSKTPDFPAFIWATFEHRNNAPDCDNLTAAPPLGGAWNFYNPTCENCPTNLYQPGTPAQVCRMHPWGDSAVGTFPGGNDCERDPFQPICTEPVKSRLAESTASITSLNANVQGLIKANPRLIDPVWANYELVGNMWTANKALPPYQADQRGALSNANSSMETFVQNGVANVTNPYSCFSCHNMANAAGGLALPPAGLSHLFHDAKAAMGCSDGRLPTSCDAYTTP